MLTTILLTFVILFAFFAALMIGLIFLKRPISGSCGGLDSAGIAKSCGCKDSCNNESTYISKKGVELK